MKIRTWVSTSYLWLLIAGALGTFSLTSPVPSLAQNNCPNPA
jgi:hypothetical protein